jgi:putative peptide zinc metalloprotease protein
MKEVPTTTGDVTRPLLAPWILVHRPIEQGAPWIVERPDANPLRISDDAGELLSTCDGVQTTVTLASTLGEQWTPDLVDAAVLKFSQLGLLAEPGNSQPKPERRLVAHSWTTLQLRLLKASRLLDPLRPMLVRLSGRTVLFATVTVFLAGVLALVLQHATLGEALGRPLPLVSSVVIWLGLAVVTIFHELGHGATLTHFQGRPGWFGVMLFYLTPACFCEVTDGWRLAKPRQRVMVAMAGVATQAAIGSVMALIALALPDGDARITLIGFAVASYASGAVNLAPWVKLDGYLALMAYLDIPHLREKAMADARGWMNRHLFGVRFTRELPTLRWAVPYGLLCIVFPLLLLTLAIGRWGHLLLNAGFFGAILKLVLVAFVVCWLGRRALSALRGAKRAGTSWTRMVGASLLVAVVLAIPLSLIKIHDDVSGGYTSDGNEVRLALPLGTDISAIRPGDPVVLQHRGLFLSTELGTAHVGIGKPVVKRVPTAALMPFRSDASMQAVTVPLAGAPTARLGDVGNATLPGRSQPLAGWLVHDYVVSAWNEVFGE